MKFRAFGVLTHVGRRDENISPVYMYILTVQGKVKYFQLSRVGAALLLLL